MITIEAEVKIGTHEERHMLKLQCVGCNRTIRFIIGHGLTDEQARCLAGVPYRRAGWLLKPTVLCPLCGDDEEVNKP